MFVSALKADALPVLRGFETALIAEASAREKVSDALALWLAGFTSDNTRTAYAREVSAFTAFAGHEDPGLAVAAFLRLEDGQAHAVVDRWRADKIEQGLSPASVNRSMSAINSLVAYARRVGLTKLRLEAKGVKAKAYRDTRGPGVRGVQNLLSVAQDQKPEKAARDAAIIRLAYGLGLRRGEIESLDIGHVDLARGMLFVLGKGRTEREPLTIPANTKQALADWLAVRGACDQASPLFVALDRNTRGQRLAGNGIYHIVRSQLGAKAGVRARPHGLRHTGITSALDAFNGDYRKARAFSRHASLDTVRRYDDNRADHAGQVAAALDSILG
jgi:integrase/recombinase XerC